MLPLCALCRYKVPAGSEVRILYGPLRPGAAVLLMVYFPSTCVVSASSWSSGGLNGHEESTDKNNANNNQTVNTTTKPNAAAVFHPPFTMPGRDQVDCVETVAPDRFLCFTCRNSNWLYGIEAGYRLCLPEGTVPLEPVSVEVVKATARSALHHK